MYCRFMHAKGWGIDRYVYVGHHILISLFLWLLEGHFCSLESIKMCTGWRGSMLKYTYIVNQILLFQRSMESNVFHDMSPLNISSSMLWSTKHNLKGRTFTRRPKEIFFTTSLSHNFPPTNIELHCLGQTKQPAHGFTGVCSKQTDTIRFGQ